MADEDLIQAQQKNIKASNKQMDNKVAQSPVQKAKEEKSEDKNKEVKKGRDRKAGLAERLKDKVAEAKGGKKEKESKKDDSKIVSEREYIVPLRKEWLKVPRYRRAKKATKALKEFIAQHMKVYDRDLKKVKIDILLNNEIRFRGSKKPPARIKVRAVKRESGIVEVKLVNIPKHIEFELARKARKEAEKAKKGKEKKVAEAPVEEKEGEGKEGEDKEKQEKKEASKEATMALEKSKAKQAQHTASKKAPVVQRKALKK